VLSSTSNLFVRALAINPARPSTLYAGTLTGVFKSMDAGESWRPLNTSLTATDVRTFVIDPQFPTRVYAASYGGGVYSIQDVGFRLYLPLARRSP
jgi:hypothetical protein